MSTAQAQAPAPAQATPTAEGYVEQAKRAFALRKYEQAVEHYAVALEMKTKELGEDSPEIADLYLAYGKALLENAIASSGVLGKEQKAEEDPADAPQASGSNGPVLSFSGDFEDDGEEKTIDLFGEAAAAAAKEEEEDREEEEHDEEDDGEEPEDDFNAAWEVLDLARAIYNKQVEEGADEEVRLKLADTYITLGDISLETEKFDQGILDYEAALKLKLDLLPTSSRHIAEAHYKLAIVLDLTPGRLSDAITHATKALESVEARLDELRKGLWGALPPLPQEASEPTEDANGKGKGKGKGAKLIRDDYVQKMSKTQIEAEIKELDGLKEDLALKVEELKASPNDRLTGSAHEVAQMALEHELNGTVSGSGQPVVVNDLTSMVKKKKKPAAAAAAAADDAATSKRKAEEDPDVAAGQSDKKVKLDG